MSFRTSRAPSATAHNSRALFQRPLHRAERLRGRGGSGSGSTPISVAPRASSALRAATTCSGRGISPASLWHGSTPCRWLVVSAWGHSTPGGCGDWLAFPLGVGSTALTPSSSPAHTGSHTQAGTDSHLAALAAAPPFSPPFPLPRRLLARLGASSESSAVSAPPLPPTRCR